MDTQYLRICYVQGCTVANCMHKNVHGLDTCISAASCSDGRCRGVTSDEYETARIERKGW